MASNPMWYESAVERSIREAQERGDFDNLPGKGKPLPNIDGPNDDLWWVRGYMAREKLDLEDALPTTLKLKKAVDRLSETVLKFRTEQEVRKYVDTLNREIKQAILLADGPAIALRTVDLDVELDRWRQSRNQAVPPETGNVEDAPAKSSSKRWPFRRRRGIDKSP